MDNIEKKNEIVAWLLSRFAAEKSKFIVTFLLLCVMGFMWMKVLTKSDPQKAAATDIISKNTQLQSKTTIEFVDLPVTKGRHDSLERDFFSPVDFSKSSNGSSSSSLIKGNSVDDDIKMAAEKLSLEAIFSGEEPEAFINDSLLKVGDSIEVERNNSKYKFVVLKIMKDKAQLKCKDTLIVIGIAGAEINNN